MLNKKLSNSEKLLYQYLIKQVHSQALNLMDIAKNLGISIRAAKIAWGKLLDKKLIPMPAKPKRKPREYDGFHTNNFWDKQKKND